MRYIGKPQRIQGGQTWCVRVVKADGRRSWRSTGTKDYRAAVKVLTQWRRAVASPTDNGMRARVAEYMEAKQDRDPHYLHLLGTYTNLWVRTFGERDVTEITSKDIDKYLHRKRSRGPCSPRTLNNERNYLSSFFIWCMRRRYTDFNPVLGTERMREIKRSVRVLTAEEQTRLLEAARACGTRIHGWLICALNSGLRRGTIKTLQWQDIADEGDGMVWLIPGKKMKARQDFRAPIHPDVATWLRDRRGAARPEDLIFGQLQTKYWKWVCERANLIGVKVHDLRRTFVTNLRRRGVPLEVAMSLSDHRDVKTVMESYRLVSVDEQLEALRLL